MDPNHEPSYDSPVSQRVVERVAAATNADPTDLEPLFGRVDPDALDALFSDGAGTTVRAQGRVTFPMSGCEVTVRADGGVEVERRGDHRATIGVESAADRSASVESPD